MKALLGTESLA